MAENIAGLAEVARQIRVARRLYETTSFEIPWIELSLKQRCPFIDQACQKAHCDDDGHNDQTTANMKFVSLDFETANANLSSTCQVGIVEFSNDTVVDVFTSLINPKEFFSNINIGIHRITSKDVDGAPEFKNIYPELVKRLSGKIVVSHMPFDRSALRQAVALHKLPDIECRWLDSARVVRRTWLAYARKSYGLRSIASTCGINFQHHDALEDARTAGLVLLRAIAESGVSLEDWTEKSLLPLKSWIGKLSLEGNPSGAFFGEYLVFTGTLNIPRSEASELATQVGCIVSSSVTQRTSILVVGDQDIARLSAGQTKSSKLRKVESMIENGCNVRIMGESDFRVMCAVESVTSTSNSRDQHIHPSAVSKRLHVQRNGKPLAARPPYAAPAAQPGSVLLHASSD